MEIKIIFEVKQAPPSLKERRGRETGRQAQAAGRPGSGGRGLRSARGLGARRAVLWRPRCLQTLRRGAGPQGGVCGLTRTSEQNVVL